MSFLLTQRPTGPLVVGCCDVMIGRSKEGTLMRLFYPTSSKLPAEPNPSIWTRWSLGPEVGHGMGVYTAPSFLQAVTGWLFNWQTAGALVPSVWCGDLLSTPKPLPVIVFSHGLIANRSMYSSVCCQLASHGFFVAALEHRDGSASSSFTMSESGEKEIVNYEPVDRNVGEFAVRSRQVGVRIEESCRTLTVLEKLNAGGFKNELKSKFDLKQLVNRLDTSRPIMAGHSFGGATTIGALAKDKRFKLGVALDPWMFPLKDVQDTVCPSVSQPFMCVSTETFQTESNLAAMSKLPSDTSSFVTIKGTVHQNQTDSPFVLGWHGRWVGGCWSELDYEQAMEINNALMLAFIHTHHGLPNSKGDPSKALELWWHLVDCGPQLGLPARNAASPA